MKIILLQDISGLGKKDEMKNVSDGYAFNFLIPNKKAVVATPAEMIKVEKEKVKKIAMDKVKEELLSKSLKSLNGNTIEVAEKANELGHLFASVHTEEISKILKEKANLDIKPEYIIVEKPIKEVGEHLVDIKIGGKTATIKITITAKK